MVINQSLSCVQLFVTPWMAACQVSLSFTISRSLLKLLSFEPAMPSNHLILCYPLVCLPSIFPSSRVFSEKSVPLFSSQCIGVLASASVLPMNIQDWFPLGLTGSPCCTRDSQEYSLAPQFRSINSLALSLLHGPTLTSICDYWKNHSFDYTDLCQQSNVSAF